MNNHIKSFWRSLDLIFRFVSWSISQFCLVSGFFVVENWFVKCYFVVCFSVWLIWILTSPSCSALLFLALRVLLWLLCLLWWDVKLELNPSNRTIKVDTESKGNKKSFIWSQETRLNVKIRYFTLFYESKFANWSKAMLRSNFLCLIVTENFMSSLRLLRLPLTAVLCFMRENLDFLFVWHKIIFTKICLAFLHLKLMRSHEDTLSLLLILPI